MVRRNLSGTDAAARGRRGALGGGGELERLEVELQAEG